MRSAKYLAPDHKLMGRHFSLPHDLRTTNKQANNTKTYYKSVGSNAFECIIFITTFH